MELPTPTEENDGYSITWESSNEDVISNTGKVTRPENGRAEVTLTAIIAFGSHTIVKPITATVRGNDYYEMKLNITGEPDVEIQENMYGLFFEDINYGADGGLYAEMIENRSFEQMTTNSVRGTGDYTANPGYAWNSENGTIAYKTEGGLNENNPTYLEFTGTSFTNQAYQGMCIENGKSYRVSFWAKSDSYTGSVAVSADTAFGDIVTSEITNEWTKYEAEITATGNARNVPFKLATGNDYNAETHDISVEISDADGNSVDTFTGLSGSVNIDDSKEYEIKVMVYDECTTDLAEGFTPIIKTTMDNSAYKLASYTTNGAEYHGAEQPIIGNSLHLAVSADGGKSYEPLNSNIGVLFAEADYTTEGGNPYRGVNKMLRNPYLFKMSDGR